MNDVNNANTQEYHPQILQKIFSRIHESPKEIFKLAKKNGIFHLCLCWEKWEFCLYPSDQVCLITAVSNYVRSNNSP